MLDNGLLRVTIDARGLIASLVDLAPAARPSRRAALATCCSCTGTPRRSGTPGTSTEHYQRSGTDLRDAESVELVTRCAERASVRVERRFGGIRGRADAHAARGDGAALEIDTDVDWHERQKLLKLAFPLDVHADRAASETQFGHVFRPTHTNTSWDAARFETCAHRWVHVGEPGYGVAVANDATYGHDITRATRADGGTTTLVRQSLLRAPLFPDPKATRATTACAPRCRSAPTCSTQPPRAIG